MNLLEELEREIVLYSIERPNDIYVCSLTCSTWLKYVSDNDDFYRNIISHITTLKFDPQTIQPPTMTYKKLCHSILNKKYVYMTNDPATEDIIDLIKKCGIKNIKFHDFENQSYRMTGSKEDIYKVIESSISQQLEGCDVLLCGTNENSGYGDMHEILGDAVYRHFCKGMAVVLVLFTGCSNLESLCGSFMKWLPVIPRAYRNHGANSQEHGNYILGEILDNQHFLTNNLNKDLRSSFIALGEVNKKAHVIANIRSNNGDDKNYPMISVIESKNRKPTVVHYNVHYFWSPPKPHIESLVNGLIYAAVTSNRTGEEQDEDKL